MNQLKQSKMPNDKMILLTGAAGFIGSCILTELCKRYSDRTIVIVDDFTVQAKAQNYLGKPVDKVIDRSILQDWLSQNASQVQRVIHLGARTDTTEQDRNLLNSLNLEYSKMIWRYCTEYRIPLLYASSAATYGDGKYGFDDSHDIVTSLEPLNAYGDSKNDFDAWVLLQDQTPPQWYGVKYFNVYGPNEYHKGRMASVIFHTFNQIKRTGSMNLFKSHRDDYADGEQSRDFIYVKDVILMCLFLMEDKVESGLYNIGTGQARSFYDLAAATFRAMGLEPNISFIDTPEDIRDKYQYFTEANMEKLFSAGYTQPTYTLEEGIRDYVQTFLNTDQYL